MRWIDVNSVDELKALGNFREVTKEIKSDVGDNIKINGRSWKDVFISIVKFRAIMENLGYTNKSISDNKTYFTSKSTEYIFYLTELDGELGMKKLGVTKTHFKNEKRATNWRDKILKEIDPEVIHHPKVDDAVKKLNKIYGSMVAKE